MHAYGTSDGRLHSYRSIDGLTHVRLVAAAKADNRSVASEIEMLLQLREHWRELVEPDHPLALPLPEVIA